MPAIEREVAELERATADPHLWNDPEQARTQMQRLADQRKVVESWRGFERRLSDAAALLEMAAAEADTAVAADLEAEVEAVARDLAAQEFELAFPGSYDGRNAVLAIHAGRGRHGVAGLGGDAGTDVPALGGAAGFPGHHRRHHGRRRGGGSRA